MKVRYILVGSCAAVLVAGALFGWRQFDGRTEHENRVRTSAGRAFAAATATSAAARAFGPDMSTFSARGKFVDRAGKSYSIGQARLASPAGECVAVVHSAGDSSSACNEPHLFSRGPVIWIEGFDGGPAPTERTSEYVAGIAANAVERIDVVESDGTSHAATFSRGNAFFFALDADDLARGIYIDHLEAVGPNGGVLRRIPLDDAS